MLGFVLGHLHSAMVSFDQYRSSAECAEQLERLNRDVRGPVLRLWPHAAYFPASAPEAAIMAALLKAKALLDELMRGILHPIDNCLPEAFHSRGKCAGGKVLKALEHSSLPRREDIARSIREHKRRWIDDTVLKRNAVAHHGHVPTYVPFNIPLGADREEPYAATDLHVASIELNGTRLSVRDWAVTLLHEVQPFVVDVRNAVTRS